MSKLTYNSSIDFKSSRLKYCLNYSSNFIFKGSKDVSGNNLYFRPHEKRFNKRHYKRDYENHFEIHENKKTHKKWVIVGFDPGLTVGIAIMDLNGNIISLKSFKEASPSEIVLEIISHGRAIIISSDVYPPPKMVKKLAASLNSKIYSPPKVMTIESKNEMVEEYVREKSSNFSPNNAHQRDALAAAIKTYKNYEKKLNQIDNRAIEKNLSFDETEEVKNLFINGTPITKALEIVLDSKSSVKAGKSDTKDFFTDHEPVVNDVNLDFDDILKLKKRIKRQETQIKNQEAIIKNLRDKNKLLKNKIQREKRKSSKIKFKLEKLYQEYENEILLDKEVASKINIIKKLQHKYNYEKSLREELEKNLKTVNKIKTVEISHKMVPVKIIKSFTREGIQEAIQRWDLKKGDVVMFSSSMGGGSQTALLLVNLSLKAVIIPDKMPHQAKEVLENNSIPVISSSKINVDLNEDFALVNFENLNHEIEKWKIKIKDQRSFEEKQKLLNVIDEYRAKRKRDPLNE